GAEWGEGDGDSHWVPVGTRQSAGEDAFLDRLLSAMRDVRDGNFRRRLTPVGDGTAARVAEVFNEIVERNQDLVGELSTLRGGVGERLSTEPFTGGWAGARQPGHLVL